MGIPTMLILVKVFLCPVVLTMKYFYTPEVRLGL